MNEATSIYLRRFRDTAALTVYVNGESTETIYLPQGMLLVLADALGILRRDIANKNYSESTFAPRTVLPNDVRFE